jgi:NAD(P)H dehydrogenase (quinone)
MLVVTTLGSPWWVDWLLLRRPVRNVLKIALLGTCAPGCKFRMVSLYRSEKLSKVTVERFLQRVVRAIQAWG